MELFILLILVIFLVIVYDSMSMPNYLHFSYSEEDKYSIHPSRFFYKKNYIIKYDGKCIDVSNLRIFYNDDNGSDDWYFVDKKIKKSDLSIGDEVVIIYKDLFYYSKVLEGNKYSLSTDEGNGVSILLSDKEVIYFGKIVFFNVNI